MPFDNITFFTSNFTISEFTIISSPNSLLVFTLNYYFSISFQNIHSKFTYHLFEHFDSFWVVVYCLVNKSYLMLYQTIRQTYIYDFFFQPSHNMHSLKFSQRTFCDVREGNLDKHTQYLMYAPLICLNLNMTVILRFKSLYCYVWMLIIFKRN